MSKSTSPLRCSLKLESLESRNLMAADITVAAGVVKVSASEGNDTIVVQEVGGWEETSLQITVKNADSGQLLASKTVAKDAVQKLVLSGQGGNDTIISQTDLFAEIYGDAGNDRIEVQSKNNQIDGGSGTDNLGGTAALEYLYTAIGVETYLNKSASTWGVKTQNASGSRYTCEDGWEYNGSWGY